VLTFTCSFLFKEKIFSCLCRLGEATSLNCGHRWAFCWSPCDTWVWRAVVEWCWQGKTEGRRKSCPSATSITTNPTWTDPAANPGPCGESNSLGYGTELVGGVMKTEFTESASWTDSLNLLYGCTVSLSDWNTMYIVSTETDSCYTVGWALYPVSAEVSAFDPWIIVSQIFPRCYLFWMCHFSNVAL
jgi:hypothetical protein